MEFCTEFVKTSISNYWILLVTKLVSTRNLLCWLGTCWTVLENRHIEYAQWSSFISTSLVIQSYTVCGGNMPVYIHCGTRNALVMKEWLSVLKISVCIVNHTGPNKEYRVYPGAAQTAIPNIVLKLKRVTWISHLMTEEASRAVVLKLFTPSTTSENIWLSTYHHYDQHYVQ